MQIRVLLFGRLKEAAGFAEQQMPLAAGATVGDALAQVGMGLPAAMMAASAVAVNREYTKRETVLRDGDELAILPPVSGGVA